MKLSLWILLVFFIGSYAQAQKYPIFERQRVKVQVYRNTITKESDDTFRKVKTPLCSETIETEVLDVRNSGGSFAPPSINCKFEFNAVKHAINLFFMSAIDRSDFDDTVQMTDVKTYMAWINPEDWNSSPTLPISNAVIPASTKDLYTKSMILHFKPHQFIVCLSSEIEPAPPIDIPSEQSFKIKQNGKDDCKIFNPEAIGATVEFETLP